MASKNETIEIHPAAVAMEAKVLAAFLTQRNLHLANRIVQLEQELAAERQGNMVENSKESGDGDTA
ncbi:hypothetical protein [Nitratireductor soli]|uniref:hypothetical protein n=1 Tax=Nitratireductor soli TaxID=1670619 RepID=UPI000B292D9D|nr:hypothetical protein [Nitratireductor soli]